MPATVIIASKPLKPAISTIRVPKGFGLGAGLANDSWILRASMAEFQLADYGARLRRKIVLSVPRRKYRQGGRRIAAQRFTEFVYLEICRRSAHQKWSSRTSYL